MVEENQSKMRKKCQGNFCWVVATMLYIYWGVCGVLILLIDPLPPHEDFGFTVQWERAVVLPEAVKQLHVFELPVLVTHWKHTHAKRLEGSNLLLMMKSKSKVRLLLTA